MFNKLINRINKAKDKAFREEVNKNKHLIGNVAGIIEDFVMILDQIQSIDELEGKSYEEKKNLRDTIINYDRYELVSKIIELDARRKEKSNSQ